MPRTRLEPTTFRLHLAKVIHWNGLNPIGPGNIVTTDFARRQKFHKEHAPKKERNAPSEPLISNSILRRRLLRTRTKDKADVVKDKPTNVVKDKADVVKAPVAKDKEKVDVVKTPVAKDNDKDKAPADVFVNDKASDDVVNEIQVCHKDIATRG
ncbi:hypothetical protein Tco_1133244 [Tanacetum coccineum]